MPWFPDFIGAAELARSRTRTAGRADPVRRYLAALGEGDVRSLETIWPGSVVVHDPRAGTVRGHRRLRRFVRENQEWLADRQARIETTASTWVGRRAVVELLAHLSGQETAWPVAVVADCPDDRSVEFRSYCSQVPVDGRRHLRPPVLEPGTAPADGVVGRYLTALGAGDTDAIVTTFAPDGYLREPIGAHARHAGRDALRTYFARCFGSGGIGLEPCAVTDDGVRYALEYNCYRWGDRDLPPQAGIAVLERGADGLLAAARFYDDVEPPGDRR